MIEIVLLLALFIHDGLNEGDQMGSAYPYTTDELISYASRANKLSSVLLNASDDHIENLDSDTKQAILRVIDETDHILAYVRSVSAQNPHDQRLAQLVTNAGRYREVMQSFVPHLKGH